jgi:hypothetical protein
MFSVWDGNGNLLGSVPSERDAGKVNFSVTAFANDIFQWDDFGFTLALFNRPVFQRASLSWQSSPDEVFVTAAIDDTGRWIYVVTFTPEDPDLALLKRFEVVEDANTKKVFLEFKETSAFSTATTTTAYTAEELTSNPSMGASLSRLFALDDFCLLSDSNDDRVRLIRFSPFVQSVRLALGENEFTLSGFRASLFFQQDKYLMIGDQFGILNVWDVRTMASTEDMTLNRFPTLKLSVRGSDATSTEWAIHGAALGDLIVVCGDESSLVWTEDFGVTFQTVKRTDGEIRSLSRVVVSQDLVVTNEFEGINILSAWKRTDPSSTVYSVSNGLDATLALSRISTVTLNSDGTAIVPPPVAMCLKSSRAAPLKKSREVMQHPFSQEHWGVKKKQLRAKEKAFY